MSFAFGGQKQKTTQNTNTSVDPATVARMNEVWEAARKAGAAGASPLATGASDYFTGMMDRGNFGMGALAGDPRATETLMDPYMRQVIDANNREWGNTNAATMTAVNDAATKAGAFGGSRHGVATGVALGENNRAQMTQNAGLLSQGFGDAMQRAALLSGYGMQSAGQNANLGMGGVGSPEQWMLMMLRQGYMGPQGQTSSGTASGRGGGFQVGGKLPFLS